MSKLNPGSIKPRYDPEGGWRKHKERIHRESKIADNKNLPFTFSKPKKAKKQITAKCKNCGYIASVPQNTVGMICPECKKYSAVEVIN